MEPGDYPVDAEWRERADAVIPGGASTASKRFASLYGDPDTDAEDTGDLPTHFVGAHGCTITTVGGEEIVDCTMALGAVAIGYGDETITARVLETIGSGHVSSLSHVLEVEVAERLCEIVPCAERVRFLKTGAEGTAAAVRVARTYTGRAHVLACGYFGWHDWTTPGDGVPEHAHRDVTRIPFDDVPALERAVAAAGTDLAAIVLEPVIEREPSRAWLERARALASNAGAALVFDEVKTGFRVRPGGYQEASGVTPDLAVFGKALANGFPLAALVGRAELMDAAQRTWITSTLASEGSSLAAASAVLDVFEKTDVCAALAETGEAMRAAVVAAVGASQIPGVAVEGIPVMWFLRFEDPALEARVLRHALRRGVLLRRGPYNFASLAHDDAAVLQIERAASTAMVEVVEALE